MGGACGKPSDSSPTAMTANRSLAHEVTDEDVASFFKKLESLNLVAPRGDARSIHSLVEGGLSEAKKSFSNHHIFFHAVAQQTVAALLPALEPKNIPFPFASAADALAILAACIDSTVVPEGVAALSAFNSEVIYRLLLCLATAIEADAAVVTKVQSLLHLLYARHPSMRMPIRRHVLLELRRCAKQLTDKQGAYAGSLLRLLSPILRGLRSPIDSRVVHEILLEGLVALAAPKIICAGPSDPNAMMQYIAPLSSNMREVLGKVDSMEVSDVIVAMFRSLLGKWEAKDPLLCSGILLVIATMVDELDGESFAQVHPPLLKIVSFACGSDHRGLSLQGWSVWKSKGMVALAKRWPSDVMKLMAPAMTREGCVHWDDEVIEAQICALEVLDRLDDGDSAVLDVRRQSGTFRREHCLGSFKGDQSSCDDYFCRLFAKHDAILRARAELDGRKAVRACVPFAAHAACRGRRHLDFVFGKVLGVGAYSVVKYAKYIETDVEQALWNEYAVKIISKTLLAEMECDAEVQREVDIQSQLSREYNDYATQHGGQDRSSVQASTVHLFAAFDDGPNKYLVTEYCPKGDLYDLAMSSTNDCTTEWLKFVMLEVAHALHYVHQCGIYYGDVKPENIVVSNHLHVKLCDFGSAMLLRDVPTNHRFAATAEYTAPDLAAWITSAGGAQPPSGEKADWWAYGCLCVQLLCGALPFEAGADQTEQDFLAAIAKMDTFVVHQKLQALPVGKYGRLPDFIEELLCPDPARRGGWTSVQNSPFFEGVKAYVECPTPPAPPLRATVTGNTSRNSGRKQSMMWRQQAVTAAIQNLGLATNQCLEQEGPECIPLEAAVPAGEVSGALLALLDGHNEQPQAVLPEPSKSRGSRPRLPLPQVRMPGGNDALAEYMTVMPRRK